MLSTLKITIMKNPFAKQNNTALIALSVTGAATAGAIAYLYLIENGTATRGKLSGKLNEEFDSLGKMLKDKFKDIASGIISNKTNISKKTVKAAADHVVK